jgi:uncharacterized membrane-anchored protein YhcB (DUF1043 family)
MQNTQEINWLLEIAKIAVPSLIALVVPLLTYLWLTQQMADYQTVLSKEIEDFKKDISKDLHQFQTKFSLFHQRQANAIEELYSLLAKTENSLITVNAYLKYVTKNELASSAGKNSEPEQQFQENWQNLTIYFEEKRIFFDTDIEELVSDIINSIENSYKFSSFSKYVENDFVKSDKTSEQIWNLATELLETKIPATKEKLKQRFRQLLSPETSNQQIETQ